MYFFIALSVNIVPSSVAHTSYNKIFNITGRFKVAELKRSSYVLVTNCLLLPLIFSSGFLSPLLRVSST